MFATTITMEILINLVVHVSNVIATITSIYKDLEIVMLELENVFSVCMMPMGKIVNIVVMDFMAMLCGKIVDVSSCTVFGGRVK